MTHKTGFYSLLLISAFFFSFVNAEYNVQIDLNTKQVQIISGDTKITTANVGDYFTGTNDVSTGEDSKSETGELAETPSIFAFTGAVLDNLQTGTELEQAIYRMYHNGLTMYDDDITYRPNDPVTREEAAKLIGQLFQTLQFTAPTSVFNCSFQDAALFNDSLAQRIQNVCSRGIFRGDPATSKYMPHDNLTKGQILAVLTRILEGKTSNEDASPRWIEYYVKMKQLSITNENNLLNIDKNLTRGETALLIYRFKNLIVNSDGTNNTENILAKLGGDLSALINQALINRKLQNPDTQLPNGSGSGANGSGGLDLDLIAGNQALVDDPEFNEAIRWMNDKQITNYATPMSYMPFQTVTREQMAKMIAGFAKATSLMIVRNEGSCSFSDVAKDSEFLSSIYEVCTYGVMNGSNGKFNPKQTVTKAEFISMIIRLVEGNTINENVNPRWTNYYQKAIDLSIISAQDTITFTSPIVRYEVAIFFYRLKTRLTMYNNLNNSLLPDEIIKTMENTSPDGENNTSAKVFIDVLALNNVAFKQGYIELFGDRYIVKKLITSAFNVGDNSFVRYGELYDLSSDMKIGNVTFTLTNGVFTEGSLRFNAPLKSYHLSKDTSTTTRYWAKAI
ncbi:hypothetical protein AGMMS50249_3370 [candidate division SR1 bacterium]|nr:hypothetical protein AGMMS50249_3370 [candidate division SR1 bacterium]